MGRAEMPRSAALDAWVRAVRERDNQRGLAAQSPMISEADTCSLGGGASAIATGRPSRDRSAGC